VLRGRAAARSPALRTIPNLSAPMAPLRPSGAALALVLALLLSGPAAAAPAASAAAASVVATEHDAPPPPQLPAERGANSPLELDATTLAAVALAAAACALSLSAGVGGGGLLVPILHAAAGFDVKAATALSQAAIAASGLGAVAFSLRRRHPEEEGKPLVDLDLALVLLPPLLLGVSLGVLLNAVLAPAAVSAAVVATLAAVSARTWRTARRLRAAEAAAAGGGAAAALAAPATPGGAARAGFGELSFECDSPRAASPRGAAPASFAPARGGGGAAAPPAACLAQLAGMWVLFAGLGLARGAAPGGRCTAPYVALYALQLAAALALTALFTRRAMAAAADAPPPGGSPRADAAEPLLGGAGRRAGGWTRAQFFATAAAAGGAGVVAGVVGLGGGFLLSPLLLELGVHPQAAAATSGLCVLFAAASATLALAAEARLNLEYAALFAPACAAAAAAGVVLLAGVVARRGASSVVFLLSAVTAAGAAATAAFDGWHALRGELVGGGGAFCAPDDGVSGRLAF
jgi:uncharacterized membrane protein YfcA